MPNTYENTYKSDYLTQKQQSKQFYCEFNLYTLTQN